MPRGVPKQAQESHSLIVTPEEAERLRKAYGEDKAKPVNDAWFPWQERVLTGFRAANRGTPYLVDEIAMLAGKGSGKAGPVSSTVWTPYGPKEMGAVKVADAVSNPDGTISRVLAVHPQGVKPIFRVTFSDGSSARCTGDHLWLVRPTKQNVIAGRSWVHDPEAYPAINCARIYTTDQLIGFVNFFADTKCKRGWQRYSFQVPLTQPVSFRGRNDRQIDPYVLGVLLGDGNLTQKTSFSFTSADPEIVSRVESKLGVPVTRRSTGICFGVPTEAVGEGMRRYKLKGTNSFSKFIPDVYQTTSVEDRLELVAGLMDTDGYVDAEGHASFTTVSPTLMRGVLQLVRGLGAKASVALKTNCGYRNEAGDKVVCQDAYTVQINSTLLPQMMTLQRKRERLLSPEKYAQWKSIVSIEPDGEEEAQCITVDNPNGLYLTDDFTVTHNSTLLRAFLIMGNLNATTTNEQGGLLVNVDRSYVYHPNYRGLVLRKNEKDLADFINRAQQLYRHLGGQYGDGMFTFPSGAVIDCGHMKDKTAYQKYIGVEYQRIAIDEAGLIADYDSYNELKSCMRSPFPELKCQIMLASNAGGPGTGWLIDRFMRVRGPDGTYIPHDKIIRETYEHPFTKEKVTKSRIWVFSTVEDNLIYRDSSYAVTLMSLPDPKMRAAYFKGEWDALFGSYFGDIFRPDGPKAHEPPQANHVIRRDPTTRRYPVELAYWWPRHIGFDWGYSHESAIMWGARSPDKRIYVYREMVQTQMSAYRAGYEIAMASRDELEKLPSHSITLWLGQDAFGQRGGDRSYAELVAMGIASVLGQDAVFVPDILIDRIKDAYEKHASNPLALNQRDEAIQQIRLQRKIGITIRKADKASTIGWQHMRELLRWEQMGTPNANFDRDLYFKILKEDGEMKANEYARVFRDFVPEVVPKLQIFDDCPRLIEAIPKVQHKDGEEAVNADHFKGRDSADGCLYLLLGMREASPEEPFEEFRHKQVLAIQQANPAMDLNDLIWVNRNIEAKWNDQHKTVAPYTPPRQARMQRLLAQRKVRTPNTIDRVYHKV